MFNVYFFCHLFRPQKKSRAPTFSSFIHQWLYSPLLDLGHFISSLILFTQTVGFLGRVISPSQGRYLHTGQHKHRKKKAHIDIHTLGGIRTHDPSVRAATVIAIFPSGNQTIYKCMISAGFEVLTAVVMESSIFRDIMPCSPMNVNRFFGTSLK
jgi:hypothetical protein